MHPIIQVFSTIIVQHPYDVLASTSAFHQLVSKQKCSGSFDLRPVDIGYIPRSGTTGEISESQAELNTWFCFVPMQVCMLDITYLGRMRDA